MDWDAFTERSLHALVLQSENSGFVFFWSGEVGGFDRGRDRKA
jgi:hypothetical protein